MQQSMGLAAALQSRRLRWQKQKRRLQFRVLSRLRKQLPSPDDVYEQHEQRFLGLLQKLLDIRKSLEHYRTTALPVYCTACASLGADVWCVVSVDAVGKGADAEKFRHAMCAINETKEAKNHFFNADAVLSGAVRFLDIHINAMRSVQSQISHRKRVKLEFDRYERKLLGLQRRAAASQAPGSTARLKRNEHKLQVARAALQTVTMDLYRVFAKYESERDTMLNGELEMVRQVMHNFYSKNAEATDFAIPEDVNRSLVDARAELIFQRMVGKELEQDALKLLPSGSTSSDTANSNNNLPAPVTLSTDMVKSASLSSLAPTAAPSALASYSISASMSGESDTRGDKQCVQETAKESTRQPESSEADELSEKLKTIQLSRPVVPQVKLFRLGRLATPQEE